MMPLFFLMLVQAAAQAMPCTDIGKIDFANAVIRVNRFEVVKFSGGKACTSDGTDITKCDWTWSIREDRTLAPEPATKVRMLLVSAKHRTGKGNWDYVIIFACRTGHKEELIEARYALGAVVQALGDRQFTVTSAHWRKGDPECCPSGKQREFFLWNTNARTYILNNTEILK